MTVVAVTGRKRTLFHSKWVKSIIHISRMLCWNHSRFSVSLYEWLNSMHSKFQSHSYWQSLVIAVWISITHHTLMFVFYLYWVFIPYFLFAAAQCSAFTCTQANMGMCMCWCSNKNVPCIRTHTHAHTHVHTHMHTLCSKDSLMKWVSSHLSGCLRYHYILDIPVKFLVYNWEACEMAAQVHMWSSRWATHEDVPKLGYVLPSISLNLIHLHEPTSQIKILLP